MNFRLRKLTQEAKDLYNVVYPNPPQNVPDIVNSLLKKYSSCFVCMFENKKLIGLFIVLEFSRNIYGCTWLVVHPNYQNKGIGMSMYNKIFDELKGIFIVKTSTAMSFHKKMGFTQISDKLCIKINDFNVDW